jgi:hypothetical protein
VAAAVLAVLVAALLPAFERSRSYRWLDRTIIVQVATTVLTAVLGIATLAVGGRLRDPLHLLYAVIVAALPVAVRLAAQGRPARTVGRWVAIAALLSLGATLRSFMTGS